LFIYNLLLLTQSSLDSVMHAFICGKKTHSVWGAPCHDTMVNPALKTD